VRRGITDTRLVPSLKARRKKTQGKGKRAGKEAVAMVLYTLAAGALTKGRGEGNAKSGKNHWRREEIDRSPD
jgi:hypothetical protein